jgi:hypothetical protein
MLLQWLKMQINKDWRWCKRKELGVSCSKEKKVGGREDVAGGRIIDRLWRYRVEGHASSRRRELYIFEFNYIRGQ